MYRDHLRHDPDVVLVGEIRDTETARIAVQASLTGHLVFSTLHTNDAPGALPRLVEMGVEPYLVASSVDTILAQRLIRLLCPKCKRQDASPDTERLTATWNTPSNPMFYGPVGCDHCRQTGYRGRKAIFEMMAVTEEIRQLVLDHKSAGDIRALARRQGLRSLREDGQRLVFAGLTSVEEIVRVTSDADDGALATLEAFAAPATNGKG